jgi:hypothetical protein
MLGTEVTNRGTRDRREEQNGRRKVRWEGTEVRDRITKEELAVKGARNRGELNKRKAIEKRREGD